MAITETFSVEGLVSVERGEVDRRIFSDPDIFEPRSSSSSAARGSSCATSPRSPRPATSSRRRWAATTCSSVRQKDGSIKGLLNTCIHRATQCAVPKEATPRPSCAPTTGGRTTSQGNLIGVPGIDGFYKGDLDIASTGLRQVARVESYKGFVFATMDPTAPASTTTSAPTGRLGIDLIVVRGDMEVIPGIQKFVDRLQLEVRGRQPLRLVPPADDAHVCGRLGHHPARPETDRRRRRPDAARRRGSTSLQGSVAPWSTR